MGATKETIQATIDQHGHQVVGVWDAPCFAYSVGLSPKIGYELFVVGLRPNWACGLINDIAEHWDNVTLDMPTLAFSNLPLMLKVCDKNLERLHKDYVLKADMFYEKEVPVIQLIMSDREGRLPNETTYDHEYMDPRQPLFVSFPQH